MDLVHPNLRCDRGASAGLRSARPTLLSVRMPSAFDIPEPIETPDLLDHGLIDRPEVQVSYRKGKLHASETWSAPAGTPHDRRIQFIERVLVGTNSASTRVIRQYWNARSSKMLAPRASAEATLPTFDPVQFVHRGKKQWFWTFQRRLPERRNIKTTTGGSARRASAVMCAPARGASFATWRTANTLASAAV